MWCDQKKKEEKKKRKKEKKKRKQKQTMCQIEGLGEGGEDGIMCMTSSILSHTAQFRANFLLLIICNGVAVSSLLQKTGKVISISAFVTAQIPNQIACLGNSLTVSFYPYIVSTALPAKES